MVSNRLPRVLLSKTARVFVSGLVSVMTPIYLATLGYSPFYIGISLLVIVAGNVFSNVLLLRYERRAGRRTLLIVFSVLMAASGFLLYVTASLPLILLAFFIGNVSTTGTEAGPFQSIETGVLPTLVSAGNVNRAFGAYNFLGYGAASAGALAASLPAYSQNGLQVFRLLYLVFGLVGLLLLVMYTGLGNIEPSRNLAPGQFRQLSAKGTKDISRLSALNSVDAFGGGFVTQSLLSYWFYLVYQVSLTSLGVIFFFVNIITAVSTFGASLIAERLGNLRTMVVTHLLSNVFLTIIPFAGTLTAALLLLFLRQSVSQMDVPTRQAFMAEIFDENERVVANATTNTFRSVGGLFGAPISGALFGVGLLAVPLVIGSASKILYDVAIFVSYRREVR
jgi:MFS family permease